MKKEDVKVGMRVKVGNVSTEYNNYEFNNAVTKSMLRFIGQEFTVGSSSSLGVYASNSTIVEGYGFPLECLTPVEQPFSLSNTKINVQKYADKNGITLKQAHEEIQPWLFEQGCDWGEGDKNISCTFAQWLNVGVLKIYPSTYITWSSSDYHTAKEITLSRKVTVELTPSFVEVEEPAVEYVELGGKKYIKKELEEALSKIKAVEE